METHDPVYAAASPAASTAARGNRPVAVAVILAVLAGLAALVGYYVVLGSWGLFMAASAFMSPSSGEPMPLYFESIVQVFLYGGLVWTTGVAVLTYRIVRPGSRRRALRLAGDAVVVLGAAMMGAALGLWPSLVFLTTDGSATPTLKGAAVCSGLGFVLAAGVSVALLAISRVGRVSDPGAAATGAT